MGRWGVVILAAVCLAAPGSADAAVPDAGVVIQGSFPQAKNELDLAKSAGIPWVLIYQYWRHLEPEPDSYKVPGGPGTVRWADLEAQLAYAKSLDLNVLLVFLTAPTWAATGDGTRFPPAPAYLGQYAEFLGDIATRVGRYVDAYAPWNEPNYGLFWNDPDPAAYVRLQKAAYPALKAADPSALVLGGPLAALYPPHDAIHPYEYLAALYQAGLRGNADVIAWNAYPPSAPEDEPRDALGRPAPASLPAQRYVRSLLDQYDPGRKVWLTELGWSTCRDCVTFRGSLGNVVDEATQADYLVRAFSYRRRYLADSVDRMFWYQLRDPVATGQWINSLGLIRADWSAKPAYAALKSLAPTQTPGTPPAQTPTQPGATSPPAGSEPGGKQTPLPPAAKASKKRSVGLSPLTLTMRNGFLYLAVTVRVSGGAARLRIEGFRGKAWTPIRTITVRKSARVRAKIRDRGYTRLGVKAKLPGSTRWAAGRVIRVPARVRR